MISAYQSALSGLTTFSAKLHSNSNNVANANTEGFKRVRVNAANVDPNGVKPVVQKIDTPGAGVFRETSEGMELIELSNVDIGQELPEMSLNSHLYKANLKTIETVDEMTQSLIDIKT